jgi:hypothetical protein
MSPNGKKPTPEEEAAAPEEAEKPEPAPTPEAPEAPTPEAPAKFDWEAELDKLPPEKQWEILAKMQRQVERLLNLSEEDRAAIIATQKEEEKRLKAQIELMEMSPEARQAKLGEAEAKVKEIGDEMSKIRRETGAYFVTIRAESERRRRAAEAEELKELMTENKDELIDLFVGALKERKPARCAAILRKLTADTNENELFNYFGYPSNIEGMHRFFAEVMIGRKLIKTPEGKFELGEKIGEIAGIHVKPLYLEPQTAFAIENDISYVAEFKGHWGVARTVGQMFGQFYQVDEEHHAEEIVAETAKVNAQQIARQFNRLAYGGEVPKEPFNLEAGRKFHISRSGLAIILNVAGILEGFIGKKEFNANAARNLWEVKDVLLDAGVRPSFIKALGEYMAERVEPDLGKVVRKAMAASLPSLGRAA